MFCDMHDGVCDPPTTSTSLFHTTAAAPCLPSCAGRLEQLSWALAAMQPTSTAAHNIAIPRSVHHAAEGTEKKSHSLCSVGKRERRKDRITSANSNPFRKDATMT
eukprot:m.331886 g.331886  ORF g.331886 m.331886 type:complete len:105 (-) comp16514_c1_seq8:3111-3425(-)